MVLNQDDVIQILKLMDESDYEMLRLETDDLKIVVNKRGGSSVVSEKNSLIPELNSGSLANEETVVMSKSDDPAPLPSVTVKESKQIIEREIVEQGLVPVNSPMLGTFYKSPKPGEPPFVEVGADVVEDTTVCIIEVMKLFSTIHAGVRGSVGRVCAGDGELVEYGQPLFLIDPEET